MANWSSPKKEPDKDDPADPFERDQREADERWNSVRRKLIREAREAKSKPGAQACGTCCGLGLRRGGEGRPLFPNDFRCELHVCECVESLWAANPERGPKTVGAIWEEAGG